MQDRLLRHERANVKHIPRCPVTEYDRLNPTLSGSHIPRCTIDVLYVYVDFRGRLGF